MERIPDKLSLADLIRNPELVRDALRFVSQMRNLEVVDGSGTIRRIRATPKSINAILDLRGASSVVSEIRPPSVSNLAGIGGIEYDDGDDHVHVFTSPGTFLVTRSGPGRVLLVAGGGGGVSGGGGGGGVREIAAHSFSVGSFPVAVGSGGAVGANGGSTSIDGQSVAGGGSGGYGDTVNYDGNAGGSGGGAGYNTVTGAAAGGAGTSGQGSAGGNSNPGAYGGGGGGGASGAGGIGTFFHNGGAGGAGVSSDITGTALFYGAGGGGEAGGAGGSSGVGGTAGTASDAAIPPIANRGGGGAADGPGVNPATPGATGVLVIRYPKGTGSISSQIGNQEFPDPTAEENEEESEGEITINSILVDDITGHVLTDDVTHNVLTNT